MTVYVKVTQKSNHVRNTTNGTYYEIYESMHLDSYLYMENAALENYQLQSRKDSSRQFTVLASSGHLSATVEAFQIAQCLISVIDPVYHLGNTPHDKECSQHPGL